MLVWFHRFRFQACFFDVVRVSSLSILSEQGLWSCLTVWADDTSSLSLAIWPPH